MGTLDDDARALRVKLDLTRSLLGDALDGVRRAGDMLDEIAAELRERGMARPEEKLGEIAGRAKMDPAGSTCTCPPGTFDGETMFAAPTCADHGTERTGQTVVLPSGEEPARCRYTAGTVRGTVRCALDANPEHDHAAGEGVEDADHLVWSVEPGLFASEAEHAATIRRMIEERQPLDDRDLMPLIRSILGARFDEEAYGQALEAMMDDRASGLQQNSSGAWEFNDAVRLPLAPPAAAAPTPAKAKRERPVKPMPPSWAPGSSTRIRLAALGIDAGPRSTTVATYHQAMTGTLRKTWEDRDFETWAKEQKRRQAGGMTAGQQSLLVAGS